jgi:hypothetical protein
MPYPNRPPEPETAMPATLPRLPRHAALLLAALVGGCAPPVSKFVPVCPQLSLLKDAADITRFAGPAGSAGAPQDSRDLLVIGRISAVPARCANAPNDKIHAIVNVTAQLRRGPAAKGDSASVPYFIAVTDGDRVLAERDFVLTGKFTANVDQVTVTGEEIDLTLPVSKTKTGAAYHVYVGLRLTPEELAYNRRQAGQ